MKKQKPKASDKATAQETPVEDRPVADVPQAQPKPSDVDDELSRVKQERDKHHDQLQRTLADLQNFRKRRGQDHGWLPSLLVQPAGPDR